MHLTDSERLLKRHVFSTAQMLGFRKLDDCISYSDVINNDLL